MVEEHQQITIRDLKAEAKQYRSHTHLDGVSITHGAALEYVAQRHGFRDWNTASAILGRNARTLSIGQRVSGRYLGHPFNGEVRGLRKYGQSEMQVEIEFDSAIDVVRFNSFSSFRARVSGVVYEDGRSLETISTGEPHLVIDQLRPTEKRAAR